VSYIDADPRRNMTRAVGDTDQMEQMLARFLRPALRFDAPRHRALIMIA
jgi:hypothetical protein